MVPAPDRAAARAKAVIRHQQAFKLALSMTLFYWLALYNNWELPHYGAFAIGVISLGTTKASIEKGLMRFFGTILGVTIGIVLVGLFNSNPWAMLAALSLQLLIISAVMKVSRYPYAWYMSAFVPLVVWADTYPHFENAFYFGTFRWLETAAGVVIYSLVELIFWPQPEAESTVADQNAGAEHGAPMQAPSFLERLWNPTILVEAFFPPVAFIFAFIIWYLVYLPPGSKFPMQVGIFALAFLRASMIPPWKIWPWLVAAILMILAPISWLVLPRLSTAAELLPLIFIYAFVASELGSFSSLIKLVLIFGFAIIAGISNQQTYSFQAPVDAGILFLLAGTTISVVYFFFEPLVLKSKNWQESVKTPS